VRGREGQGHGKGQVLPSSHHPRPGSCSAFVPNQPLLCPSYTGQQLGVPQHQQRGLQMRLCHVAGGVRDR
jgi:hypothetical protein